MPGNWLNHYLPVDRVRIKGCIWRYVSTDLDTYYHEPSSQLMLEQSPDNVIGFASAADAEEAGYLPEPNLRSSGTRLASGLSAQGLASLRPVGSSVAMSGREGGTISIPWSQIPPDVRIVILLTDRLADVIENASQDELVDLKLELAEMHQGTVNGHSLAAMLHNREAFADMSRWEPILQLLEAAVDARMNTDTPVVAASVADQDLRMAREAARMQIPGVKAAMLGNFNQQVQQAGQQMLRRR